MVFYCENKEDCRRQLLLKCLGEEFDSEQCKCTCDNCASPIVFEETDFTEKANSFLNLVHSISTRNRGTTLNYAIQVWEGRNTQLIRDNGHQNVEEAGAGKSLSKTVIQRLARLLIQEKYLKEKIVYYKEFGNAVAYISFDKPLDKRFTMKVAKHQIRQISSSNIVNKSNLIDKLFSQLKLLQNNLISNGINTNDSLRLIKMMSHDLPTSLFDLLDEKYTSFCSRNVLKQVGIKFIECINKFIAENPEVKAIQLGGSYSASILSNPSSNKAKKAKLLPAPSSSSLASRRRFGAPSVTVAEWPPRSTKKIITTTNGKPALVSGKLSQKDKKKLVKKLI